MSPALPAPTLASADRGSGASERPMSRHPGWPLTALLTLYPLWWLLGMGTLIVFVLVLPMVLHLWRRRRIVVPPGFGLWLLFLAWVVASTAFLGMNPPGTLPDTVSGRIVSVGFNLAGYLSATIVLLYAGNLSETEFPRRRLVRHLGGLFVVVVAGGLLGTFAPTFDVTSPVELLLPDSVAEDVFVQSLVHPTAAQLHEVLGYQSPRPSAPFGFTNTWGHCFALLLGWFLISHMSAGHTRRRAAGLVVLLLAAIPVVYSLNRGLWLGLGLALGVAAVRLARRGRFAVITGLVAALSLTAVLLTASPLGAMVQARLDNGHSNDIRTFTTQRTLEVLAHSPVMGFGSTRAALGSSNSIVVGSDADCRRCGNPTLGSNGQVWLLLIAQGIGGTALYVGFLLRSLWAYRRDRTPIGDGGRLVLVLSLAFMLVYNALTMPLVITFLSIALMWRQQRDEPARPAEISRRAPASRPVLLAGQTRSPA